MRIVLDSYWWVRGTQSLRGVVHGLVNEWAASFPDDELIVVTRHLRNRTEDMKFPSQVRVVQTRVWPQALVAMLVVPWVAWRSRAEAMLTHNFTPLFGRGRTVMIQDAIFATNPEWFTRKELAYFRWMLVSSRRAHTVFSSTAVEAQRLARFTHCRRIRSVGLGLDPRLVSSSEGNAVAGMEPKRFILAVGRLNIRKNLVATLEGARLSGCVSPDHPLVIVGEREGEWSSLPDWVDQELARGVVRFTGFVDVDNLRWLLRECALFVCLSLDEGFGLPPVEARALGARVLVSDAPVFRETMGDEATYVDPKNRKEIGLAIKRLVTQGGMSEPPSASFVARHSWRKTVAAIRQGMNETTLASRIGS